jgi:hypothetical protein
MSFKKISDSQRTQIQFDELLLQYMQKIKVTEPYKEPELEVRFKPEESKHFTKLDYDSVIQKLMAVDYSVDGFIGEYRLLIFPDQQNMPNLRIEIMTIEAIQEYCKTDDVVKVHEKYPKRVKFIRKNKVKIDEQIISDVYFNDFNFSISLRIEETQTFKYVTERGLFDDWNNMPKKFRYSNRVTFYNHEDELNPTQIDLTIVQSSAKNGSQYIPSKTIEESNVFNNVESYEIEIEIINKKANKLTIEQLSHYVKKTNKYILSGLQGTNYPISYPQQRAVYDAYIKMLNIVEKNKYVSTSNFIGPSSVTLQLKNIMSESAGAPNIRTNYTVTDKADGERRMLFINKDGKMYLISGSMKIMFTGASCKESELFNTLIDGELIMHDKKENYINYFAAFDIYFKDNKNIREKPFMVNSSSSSSSSSLSSNCRYAILLETIGILKQNLSFVAANSTIITFQVKEFYSTDNINIFEACNIILSKSESNGFAYLIDGLILTPTDLAVGANNSNESAGPLRKSTWQNSFKWKPASFSTVDFLVRTKKTAANNDLITPIFEDGQDMESVDQLKQYKTLILQCGYDISKNGYINPCKDIIEGNIETKSSKQYYPEQFHPSNPYDTSAGICNIMLTKNELDDLQIFTTGGEVILDNTIVEFRYDDSLEKSWKWVPIKVRYDKTSELKQGYKNYGNSYDVANSNWYSIHHPIDSNMIRTGDINENYSDEDTTDIYYNNVTSSTNTQGLRDFHNLYVKKLLIHSVSNKNDTLIDFACGKAGDLPKWINSRLGFVFGIDYSKDNIENRINGACARLLSSKQTNSNTPDALFVAGNSTENIKNGKAFFDDMGRNIKDVIFGINKIKIGKGVDPHYNRCKDGFSISSCQFAIHYFFENLLTFHGFMRNVAECTKLNGYFIGTSYDGTKVFDELKRDGIFEVYKDGNQICKIVRGYDKTEFEDDETSLGYKIDVFQESINQSITEYLVNFNYLKRIMTSYGFRVATSAEARMKLRDGIIDFETLFADMKTEIYKNKRNDYRNAGDMDKNEQMISFLNNCFVFKKFKHFDKQSLDRVHDRFINKTPDENEIEQKENVEIADIVLPNKIVENVEDDAAEKNDVAEEKDAAVEEKLVVKQKRAYVRKPKIVIEGEESTVKNKTRPTVAKNAKKTLKITEDDV